MIQLILNDATNWGPEADRMNAMFSELYDSVYKQEVQLLAASKVIRSFQNYDAIMAEFNPVKIASFGVLGFLVANIETGTLWQLRVVGWVNTNLTISGANYNKFDIHFSNTATPDIVNYQTTLALVFGQSPTVRLWIGSDETSWTLDASAAQTELQGGLINRFYFDYGESITGKIVIS